MITTRTDCLTPTELNCEQRELKGEDECSLFPLSSLKKENFKIVKA